MRGLPFVRVAAVAAVTALAALAFGTARAAAMPLPNAPNCPIFPATNVWNKRVDSLPVAADSATMIQAIGLNVGLHPDFGSNPAYGIPINVVGKNQPKRRLKFLYASQSDRGPYPIPTKPRIEAGSDRHMLIVDRGNCKLYELWEARKTTNGWHAGSGAIWSLESNALRPSGWTSADAAGLPILPGLVRHYEVKAGVINHALRFTAPDTCAGHIYPARHDAGSGSCTVLPPMGLRLRLKASFNVSSLPRPARVIATALKRYGMILADNGSPWYIQGFSNPLFNNDALHELDRITGADLEVVDTSTLRNG
ncbi:MAG TPA: hypothetical protein VGL44_03375 [Gaiellales bacterium]|jgi:hypothetical protein